MNREGSGEAGEALVEFIGLMVALVIPVLYIVLALSSVQAAVLAAEAGSREAVRVLAADPGDVATARLQVELAFEDFGLPAPDTLEAGCRPADCQGPDAVVRVRVATVVPLPLVPGWVGQRGLLPVSSTSEAPIEGLTVNG